MADGGIVPFVGANSHERALNALMNGEIDFGGYAQRVGEEIYHAGMSGLIFNGMPTLPTVEFIGDVDNLAAVGEFRGDNNLGAHFSPASHIRFTFSDGAVIQNSLARAREYALHSLPVGERATAVDFTALYEAFVGGPRALAAALGCGYGPGVALRVDELRRTYIWDSEGYQYRSHQEARLSMINPPSFAQIARGDAVFSENQASAARYGFPEGYTLGGGDGARGSGGWNRVCCPDGTRLDGIQNALAHANVLMDQGVLRNAMSWLVDVIECQAHLDHVITANMDEDESNRAMDSVLSGYGRYPGFHSAPRGRYFRKTTLYNTLVSYAEAQDMPFVMNGVQFVTEFLSNGLTISPRRAPRCIPAMTSFLESREALTAMVALYVNEAVVADVIESLQEEMGIYFVDGAGVDGEGAEEDGGDGGAGVDGEGDGEGAGVDGGDGGAGEGLANYAEI